MNDEKRMNNTESWLNEALKTNPDYGLSDDFAERMAAAASRKFAWSGYVKEFLIYLLAIVGIMSISAGMIFIWFQTNVEEWTNFLLANLSWAIGINILVIFILFADRVLLRYFLFRSEKKWSN